jgi:hypothetical protein
MVADTICSIMKEENVSEASLTHLAQEMGVSRQACLEGAILLVRKGKARVEGFHTIKLE